MMNLSPGKERKSVYKKGRTRTSIIHENFDEEDGTARSMLPRNLWKSRKEYQDFTLKTFRKHIYQERLKQLAAPYWQHKRNEAGEKKRREDTGPDGEKFVADSGYAGEPDKIVMTRDEQTPEFKEFLARCKNRGETFHWRLKAFNILGGRFRHGTGVENRMELHRMAVDVVVGVIQYDYENGHPPFDVR